jgi:succinate-semialdehyde dehydrogenase / glutarate-semialdehyde dehydrogenase
MESINPANNQKIQSYSSHQSKEIEAILDLVEQDWHQWKSTSFSYRKKLMHQAAGILRERKSTLATLITQEMGKIIRESEAEIEKCAWVCDFYADNAEAFLHDESIPSDAAHSFLAYQPLGIVLAVMPWNFPFWQVFRFAAPGLMAGNAGVLKHASNVPGCALAIEQVFRDAGFPGHLFRTLMIGSDAVNDVIRHPAIAAVTLTGSEMAGSAVASEAGKQIKKSVLELGGSDPFVVMDDCDLELTISNALVSRMLNQGQSCIAAKRFIVMESVLEPFTQGILERFQSLKTGDPLDPDTDVGPLARPDLVEEIYKQVVLSVSSGAKLLFGGKPGKDPGCYFEPTILTDVRKGMPVYDEETFGPVLVIIPVKTEEEAIQVANDSKFGLGGSVWTKDVRRGEFLARSIESGAVFVNGMTKSDPRLPFGGIKLSGYGRELGQNGIREFVNVKTIWIG